MKREYQIHKAADEYINSDAVPAENIQMAYGDFTRGAEWADNHPNWQNASKAVPMPLFGRSYSKDVLILVKWCDSEHNVTTMHFGCYDHQTEEWCSSDGTVRKNVSWWLDIKKPDEV